MSYEIQTRNLPERDLAAVKFRASAAEIPARMPEAFGEVLGYLQRTGVAPQGPAVTIYEQASSDVFDVAAGFYVASPIEGDGHVVPARTPQCQAAATTHVGSYASLPQAYAAVQGWLENAGYKPSRTMWEEYWSPPGTPPGQTRTDLIWPLEQHQSNR